MSKSLDINTLSDQEKEKFNKELNVVIPPTKYIPYPKTLTLYSIINNNLIVPFSSTTKSRPKRESFTPINTPFEGKLREEQIEVKNEALTYLNKNGSVIIACYPSFGKTCMAIYIASLIKLKTMIICHRIILINQWKESIKAFCPSAKICVISDGYEKDADFYIVNAVNVSKRHSTDYRDIGFLIVDECHLIMAEKLSLCMTYFFPRYLLGLSATPYRNDGLEILFTSYFGPHKIIRKLFREHLVYKINTNIVPETKMTKMGKLDWGSVLDSLSNNIKRNQIIIDIVKKFSDRTFLILCKRKSQAIYLIEKLQEEKEHVSDLVGKKQKYDKTCRILVATTQKAGVGFDDVRLNALILAMDVQDYFYQYLGRVFRAKETKPIIFDLVDNFKLLQKHFYTRSQDYIQCGGIIENYKID